MWIGGCPRSGRLSWGPEAAPNQNCFAILQQKPSWRLQEPLCSPEVCVLFMTDFILRRVYGKQTWKGLIDVGHKSGRVHVALPVWLLFLYLQLIPWHFQGICSKYLQPSLPWHKRETLKDKVCSRGTTQACLCGNIKEINLFICRGSYPRVALCVWLPEWMPFSYTEALLQAG